MLPKKGYSAAITEILLESGAVASAALEEAVAAAKSGGTLLEKYLVEKNLVSTVDMALATARYLNIPALSLAHFTPSAQLIELIPREVLVKHRAFPVARIGKSLTVALGDPFDMFAMDELNNLTSYEITPVVAAEKDILDTIERAFPDEGKSMSMEEILKEADPDLEVGQDRGDDEQEESIEKMLESAECAPVVKMVNVMLLESLKTGASDIHMEPQEKTIRLRYRIDGELIERPSPPKHLQGAVISRMKLMSGMDIAERRIPQDGRIKIHAMNKEVDLRVNSLPTIFGEKVVMRILDKSFLFPNLAAMGLDDDALHAMQRAINQPHGIVLVTGPTGSGKTTTLYSCLQELNRPDVNIITVEDPVEYQIEGLNQIQINAHVGLNFGIALRSVLRQSPDIILVGETRDTETAEIAIKAALTGHLVFSTLHTNDAAGAITRLVDMGVEPSLLASSIILAQAQRLIRKLCQACKKPTTELPVQRLLTYGIDPSCFDGFTVYEPAGCPKCRDSGYKGRAAIMEVLRVDRELRRDILRGASSREITMKAKEKGMLTLKDIGVLKIKQGVTSIDAALEVTGGD